MKTTVVPAQVTTVEDKIAGNLSFTQLLLLVTPVFLDGAVFVILPPVFNYSLLKLVISIGIALACMTLAIRIKGKILLAWIAIIARYRLRPKYYLFNKNNLYLREQKPLFDLEPEPEQILEDEAEVFPPNLIPTAELVRLETAVHDPRANFHIKLGKGGFRVHIREVKEETV
ncbi:MAG: PrgI family protein [Patescibacteria group bacterium]